MIRFGVIGARRGKVHLATIASNRKAKLAYIADNIPNAAEELAAKHSAKVVSVEDIMKPKDVDVWKCAVSVADRALGRYAPSSHNAESIDP